MSEIKKAGQLHEYTHEQLIEFAKCARDPVYFIKKYVKIRHPKKGSIPFDLYPYQEKMIRAMMENRWTIILSSRQTGKSETSGAFLLWYAMFNEDKTVLIASNKMSNALEMIARIRYMYESIPDWLKPGITKDGWNKLKVSFDNYSRILSTATTPDSGRGLPISLLFCDELAFVPANVQDEFWASIQPTLSTGGSCIISSTPNGDTDLFSRLWREAEMGMPEAFYSVRVRWNEPPGRGEQFKKEMIGKLGELTWKQEFECEFLTSDALLIDTMFLDNLTRDLALIEPLNTNLNIEWYTELKKGETYLMGVDPATGTGRDHSVIEVYHFPSLVQVAEFRNNKAAAPYLYTMMKQVWKVLMEAEVQQCYFTVENNGVGEGVIALFEMDENAPEIAEFISEEGRARLGMTTTNRSKLKACLGFKNLLEGNKLKIKSKTLLKELKSFAVGKGSYEALPGATDDAIMASLLVVRLLHEISTYEDKAHETLYTFDESEFFNDSEGGGEEEPLAMIF
jgi:hypothetical protein